MNVLESINTIEEKIKSLENLIEAIEIHKKYYSDIVNKVIYEFWDVDDKSFLNEYLDNDYYNVTYYSKIKEECLEDANNYCLEKFSLKYEEIPALYCKCWNLSKKYTEELEELKFIKYKTKKLRDN